MRSHFTDVVTLARPAMMLTDGFDEIKGDAKYVCVCTCVGFFLKGIIPLVWICKFGDFHSSRSGKHNSSSAGNIVASLSCWGSIFRCNKTADQIVFKHELMGNLKTASRYEWHHARDVTNLLFVYKLTNKSAHTQSRV